MSSVDLSFDLGDATPPILTLKAAIELSCTPSVSVDRLEYLANYLTPDDYQSVIEERDIASICGWPICDQSSRKKQLRAKSLFYSLKEDSEANVYKYCCREHCRNSNKLLVRLHEEPWSLRNVNSRVVSLDWLRESNETVIMDDDRKDDYSIQKVPDQCDMVIVEEKNICRDLEELSLQLKSVPVQSQFPLEPVLVDTEVPEKSKKKVMFAPEDRLEEVHFYDHDGSECNSHGGNALTIGDNEMESCIVQEIDNDSHYEGEAFTESIFRFPLSMKQCVEEDESESGDEKLWMNFPPPPPKNTLNSFGKVVMLVTSWIMTESMRICSDENYDPIERCNNAVDEKEKMEVNAGFGEMDKKLKRLPIENASANLSRRKVTLSFVQSKVKQIIRDFDLHVEEGKIQRTLSILISTFVFYHPLEGLVSSHWLLITLALLNGISRARHPELKSELDPKIDSIIDYYQLNRDNYESVCLLLSSPIE